MVTPWVKFGFQTYALQIFSVNLDKFPFFPPPNFNHYLKLTSPFLFWPLHANLSFILFIIIIVALLVVDMAALQFVGPMDHVTQKAKLMSMLQ